MSSACQSSLSFVLCASLLPFSIYRDKRDVIDAPRRREVPKEPDKSEYISSIYIS